MKSLQIALSTALLFLFFACSDPCADVNCGDNGTCNQGLCICDEGYEGFNCEAKIIDKFTGTWVSTDFSCDGELEPVTFVFEQGSTITDLRFYDAEDEEIIISVNYAGNNISIDEQEVDEATVSGSGSLTDANTFLMFFQIVDEDNDSYSCSGTFTKQ